MTDLERRFRSVDRLRAPDLRHDIRTREPQPPRREIPWGRLGTAALALVVAATGFAFAARAFFGEGEERPAHRREPAPAPLDPRVTATIPLGPVDQEIRPGPVAVGEGAVWVLAYFHDETPHERLLRIDPTKNEVSAEILLPHRSTGEVAVGFGSIWVSLYQQGEGSSLGRIDPQTNQLVAEIPGLGQQVAIGEGSVWAIDTREGLASGSVAQVDPATNELVASVPLPIVHPPVFDLVAGDGAVWAWTLDDVGDIESTEPTPNLFRIDPVSQDVKAIDIDTAGYRQIVIGGGHVWVAGGPQEQTALDSSHSGILPVDSDTGASVGDPIELLGNPVAYGEGGAWFTHEGFCRVNAQSLEVDVCTPLVPIADPYDQAVALDMENGVLWVSNFDHTITRIDLRSEPEKSAMATIDPRRARWRQPPRRRHPSRASVSFSTRSSGC